MSKFVPTKEHLRNALLLYFNQKKSAAESYRLLFETYGDIAPHINTCEKWFKRFRSGDFNLDDKVRPGQPKKFEDTELEALLEEDCTQTQEQLAEKLNVTQKAISKRLHALGKILKSGRWVPHELNDRQMERRQTICETLLARYDRKSFLDRIVTSDEKWIYYKNPKRKKSWVDPGQASASTPRPDRFGKKAMLCIWWDQMGEVYRELLQPGETVNAARYRQQLISLNHALMNKRPEWAKKHGKVLLLHDNAPSHTAKLVKETLKSFNWEILPHPPYSPDLAPSDYYLFASMAIALKEQNFKTFEELKNWLDDWMASKPENFFWKGIHALPERWTKCVENQGQYFE